MPNGTNRIAEKTVIVGLVLSDGSRQTAEEHLDELEQLVVSAGGSVVGRIIQEKKTPDPATWIGKGKAAEVEELVKKQSAKSVIFDDDLSPAQVRNLEKIVNAKVVDRSGLILDIFARQARSREARTQVELAQLNYLLPRLTRQWSHLSRQQGGIGTRGVGETQLELDRRITRTRIRKLKEELEKIEKTRETQRRGREAAFTVALVGYTNAGKSTLFNRLTNASVEAVDRLFATLDAKLQRAEFEAPRQTVIIDTVGFIRKLPHHLVASFRSTMEEAVSADLVLHLVNLAHPQVTEQRDVGREVLADLGVAPERVLDVYNKSDAVQGPLVEDPRDARSITVSALTGSGIDRLIDAIRARERALGDRVKLEIPHGESRLMSKLFEVAEVQEQIAGEDTTRFIAWIPSDALHLFEEYVVTDEQGKRNAS